MSGMGGSEFLLLCVIGLLILGPERLPAVARKIGGWVGKARAMTRSLQHQLEDELNAEKTLGFDPAKLKNIQPSQLVTPRDDDTYSPKHEKEKDKSDGESVTTPANKDQ